MRYYISAIRHSCESSHSRESGNLFLLGLFLFLSLANLAFATSASYDPYTIIGVQCGNVAHCAPITEGRFKGYYLKSNIPFSDSRQSQVRPHMFTRAVLKKEIGRCVAQGNVNPPTLAQCDRANTISSGHVTPFRKIALRCDSSSVYCRYHTSGPYAGLIEKSNIMPSDSRFASTSLGVTQSAGSRCIREGVSVCDNRGGGSGTAYYEVDLNCNSASRYCQKIESGRYAGLVKRSNVPNPEVACVALVATPRVLKCRPMLALLPNKFLGDVSGTTATAVVENTEGDPPSEDTASDPQSGPLSVAHLLGDNPQGDTTTNDNLESVGNARNVLQNFVRFLASLPANVRDNVISAFRASEDGSTTTTTGTRTATTSTNAQPVSGSQAQTTVSAPASGSPVPVSGSQAPAGGSQSPAGGSRSDTSPANNTGGETTATVVTSASNGGPSQDNNAPATERDGPFSFIGDFIDGLVQGIARGGIFGAAVRGILGGFFSDGGEDDSQATATEQGMAARTGAPPSVSGRGAGSQAPSATEQGMAARTGAPPSVSGRGAGSQAPSATESAESSAEVGRGTASVSSRDVNAEEGPGATAPSDGGRGTASVSSRGVDAEEGPGATAPSADSRSADSHSSGGGSEAEGNDGNEGSGGNSGGAAGAGNDGPV